MSTPCAAPRRTALSCAFALVLLFASCSSGPETKEDSVGPLNSITTQADVRSFYVKSDPALPDYGRFVAEPSPDVFANVVEKLSAIAKASKGADASAAELQILRELTREAVRLGVRSQGVIYLRDACYRLSEAYMNGAFFPRDTSRATDACRDARDARPSRTTAMDTWRSLGVSAFESVSFQLTFRAILDNARALIEAEIRANPTLSRTAPEDSDGEAADAAGTVLPRLTADFGGSKERSLGVTFRNRALRGVDVNVAVAALDDDGDELLRKTLVLRTDDAGRGTAKCKLPKHTARVVIDAPTSTPLVVDVD